MRRANRRTILLSTIFMIFVIAVTFISSPAVKADENSGSKETARQKEWYSMIKSCVSSKSAFRNWGVVWINTDVSIPANQLRDGNWFRGVETDYGSPFVEKEIYGNYGDGKIYCDAKDNKLVKAGIANVLGLNYVDVICNYKNTTKIDSSSWGILGQGNKNATCVDAYNNKDDDEYFRHYNTNANSYLDELVKDKVFSGNIPAGSMGGLTYLEQYWVVYDAFMSACATGSGIPITSENRSSNQFPYVISEVRNGEVIEVGYSGRDNPNSNTEITYFYNAKMTCSELSQAIHEGSRVDALKESVAAGEVEDSDDNNNQAEQNCQNSGGAGSLGWIVCSILDWMSEATEGLYDGVVEPALRVEPELFQNGSSDTSNGTIQGAEGAWAVFRDFANILFIIIVLVVIFSQLTGVGIDNYGIKKILPKLIIVAILVNLSYLICLICVDLSNIVGNGIQDLFNSINISGGVPTSTYGGVGFANDAGFVAVSIAGAAVGAVAIYSNPALLLTLFVSVLGVLISVLFLFILLAGRKAAIVLLTVISPIAIILYMLPNTKKIFDKWLNLWKAMLILYPACGLLIGGGNFASRLMVSLPNSSESAATVFVAMIVGIVPIFFIPSLVKSAYSALGSIGGTITGFGGRFRGGLDRRARGSQVYQRAQKRSQDRSQRIGAMRRAGLRLDKDGNVVESRRPTARLRRRVSGTWVGRRLGLGASMDQNAAEFAKIESARRDNKDNANIDMINTQFVKDENARMMRRAERDVGVVPIDDRIARARAEAARSAQARKAFQDQYANYSIQQLKAEANQAATLRGKDDGSERVSALISAMESRGLENDVVEKILKNDSTIHDDAGVMATLAGSNNKVLKAFGKKGKTTFNDFMNGTGTDSMQGYIKSKGKEFLDGLDDKAIAQIRAYNNGAAMSTDLLVEAMAGTKNADSIRELNAILANRGDIKISGNQLANFDESAITNLFGNNKARTAMLVASDDIANDTKLINNMNPKARNAINRLRRATGRSPI